jgi:hypothetical protein
MPTYRASSIAAMHAMQRQQLRDAAGAAVELARREPSNLAYLVYRADGVTGVTALRPGVELEKGDMLLGTVTLTALGKALP